MCSDWNFEENEAEIMQQMLSENANGHDEADYEEKENDKIEATPSSTEMKFILHRLELGLERTGFEWTSLRSLVTACNIFYAINNL